MDKKLRHYKCPKCGKLESGVGCIPECKCSGLIKTNMEETKSSLKGL